MPDNAGRLWSNPPMHTPTRRLLGAAALAALASLATATVALGQDSEEVIISDTLAPQRLEVPAGTVVTWRNEDGERHRVRSRQGPVEFDSGNLEPGEQFSVTFVVAGEYPYLDERNDEDPAYFGTIVVIDDQPTGGPPPLEATVTLIDESYQPPALEVAVGATVTWENIDGDDDHTVTSTDGVFNSGVFAPGTDFQHTFDTPGAFPYFCAIHPEMEGTITVVGDAPAPDASTAVESAAPVESAVAVESPTAAESAAAVQSTATPTSEPAAVSIIDLTFDPATIEVDAGATVTWTNDDSVPHTVTARDADFNSGVMMSADSFSQTFSEPGTYDYFCAIHPSMTGTVVVREPAAAQEVAGAGVDLAPDEAAAAAEVSVLDVAYQPADIVVPVGTTVDWTNEDPFAHTVTARDAAFDSGNMDGGGTFSQTFSEPGTFEYFCEIHPSMTGTVTVTP
jgi:plastocyanin